ncbi:PREDICTED: putative nuclease HARBI1 [Vollenhovia emeryi]|uniref:putative nuclease HARBI1 n=1 Tax=Vollenhovia emeryi TaxID=411798 RepID=UPI0005F44531|nr:PREDICTED: putative nuclease HARBI1 [Vollenhovia emeryi]
MEQYSDYSNSLLQYFVETFINLYGKENASHNLHHLLHICDDAKKFGTLQEFSAFPFENYLQSILKMIRKNNKELEQIVCRITERNYCINSNFRVKYNEPQFFKPHSNGPLINSHNCNQFGKAVFKQFSYFSINTQVVCDYNLKAIDIVARWPGSVHDATIFEHSTLRRRFEQNEFNSGLLLGDGGYPVRNYLLTPLINPNTPAEECYNETQIRTRNIIERFFGVIKRRFPVLSLGMRLKLETVQDVIVATTVLHNLARHQNEGDPPVLIDFVEDDVVINDDIRERARPRDNMVRESLIADYFSRLRR